MSDTDEFRYSTATFDGAALLGVMSWDVEPDWCVFLGADDVDKTVQLVLDNGGSVIREAETHPMAGWPQCRLHRSRLQPVVAAVSG